MIYKSPLIPMRIPFLYFLIFRNGMLPGGWRPLGASLTPLGQGLWPCPNKSKEMEPALKEGNPLKSLKDTLISAGD